MLRSMAYPAMFPVRRCLSTIPNKQYTKRVLLDAKRAKGLSFSELAEKLNVNKVWLVAAIHGQHPISRSISETLLAELGLDKDKELMDSMEQIPACRGETVNDPIVTRLHELVSVYGESIKELIREEAGDGIMSAIDCELSLETETITNDYDQEETRIVLKINGKYLPYKC